MESPSLPQFPPIPPLPPTAASSRTASRASFRTEEKRRFSVLLIVGLLLVGLVAGGLIGYSLSYSNFNSKLTDIQNQLSGDSQGNTYNTYPNATYNIGTNVSLSTLYNDVKSSVVVIKDLVPLQMLFGEGYEQQQGSGFVTSVNNQLVIVTRTTSS